MNVYTVLRQSAEYTPAHVERLRGQLDGVSVVTLSDVPIQNRVPLKYNWPGWWSKMELFRPDIKGDVFYMDLDTTINGDVRPFMEVGKTTLLSDFYRPEDLQSSLMYLTAKDRGAVWDTWNLDPQHWIDQYGKKKVGHNGDQNFIQYVLGRGVQRWQDIFPGRVLSFKVDIRGKANPPKPDITIFHGNPRPWTVGQ